MVRRKAIRFSPVELALVAFMTALFLLNLWQGRIQGRVQQARD